MINKITLEHLLNRHPYTRPVLKVTLVHPRPHQRYATINVQLFEARVGDPALNSIQWAKKGRKCQVKVRANAPFLDPKIALDTDGIMSLMETLASVGKRNIKAPN